MLVDLGHTLGGVRFVGRDFSHLTRDLRPTIWTPTGRALMVSFAAITTMTGSTGTSRSRRTAIRAWWLSVPRRSNFQISVLSPETMNVRSATQMFLPG